MTAVDFSDIALAKAAELATARGVDVEWVLDDVVAYKTPPVFDLVAVLYLQLPADELAPALRIAAAALAPGGTLVVIGHDSANLVDGHGGPKDAAVLFTPDDVVGAIGDLVVERAETVHRTVALDDGHEATALDAFVRARRDELSA